MRSSLCGKELALPRGDKDAYTDKQKRQAEHVDQDYERGLSPDEAERRAWATVNGGNKSGSGRGKEGHEAARHGGRKGGTSKSASDRSAAAKKGWQTRRRKGDA